MYTVHILNHAPHMSLKAEPTDSRGTARAERWYHAVDNTHGHWTQCFSWTL